MTEKTLFLNNKTIASTLSEIQDWLHQESIEDKNILHISLSIEELLLRWQDYFGENKEFTLTLAHRFKQPYMLLTLKGEEYDPTVSVEEDIDWSNRVLSQLGLAPTYSYRRGTNRLTLAIKNNKKSATANLLITIALSIILGFCGKLLFPQSIDILAEGFIIPLRSTLLNLLSAVAVPMVFISILLGICETGSASEFGKIGNRMLLGFVGKTLMLTAIFTIIFLPLFSLNYSEMTFSPQQVSGTFQMLLDILPRNIVEPFSTGNTLQVIVIAITLGLALLILGEQANEIKNLAKKAYSLIELILQWVCRLLPLIVFLILIETMWTSDLSILIQLWKPLCIVLLCGVITTTILTLRTAYKYKIKLKLLLPKLAPSMLIAFTTSSSAAALGETLEGCQKKLGINRKIACFGVPTGAVMYMPVSAIYFAMCLLYSAEHFQISCSPAWLVLACITASLLAVAVPPIPGGAMACYTVMFLQMGIPAEAIVFAITLDIIIDRFNTTCNLTLLQLDLIHFSNKQHLLDQDTLRG